MVVVQSNYTLLKEEAINLRKRGLSYSEILRKISVAKSTLSLWLRSVGLSKRQKQRLTEKKLSAMRRGWLKVRRKRLLRTLKIKREAKKDIVKLIKNPLWLSGVLLYWAEGTKEKLWRPAERVAFSNMDVKMIKLFYEWSKKFLKIDKENINFELYIHERADIIKAKNFWIRNLKLTPGKISIYFKRHNPKTERKNVKDDYNGVLRIRIAKSIDINRKIAGWIEGVIDYLKV